MTNRREAVAAVAATAALVAMTLVIREITKPVYKTYLPVVHNYRRTLKSEFARHGMFFGFAVGEGSFENPTTRAIIEEHASIVTPENAMKMEYNQPQRGVFDFSETDVIVAYADVLGIGVHGHTASWHSQNPDWLINGNFTKQELKQILSNHVSTLSSHYAGKLVSLDTANEGYLGCGPWCPLGTNDYVFTSFNAAGNATPLIYNSIFPNVAEENFALWLLDNNIADGIGIQLHLATSTDWQGALARTDSFLNRIRSQGRNARFSEVGVHGEGSQQAVVYAAVTRLALKYSDVIDGIIIWGVRDPAWRGDVTLFDSSGELKQAYYAVMDELR